MAESGKYFSRSELSCRCCDTLPEGGIDDRLIAVIDGLREKYGAMTPNCVYRCDDHNANTPGAATHSYHTLGMAADMPLPTGIDMDEYAEYGKSLGANGTIRYYSKNFVHFDVRPEYEAYHVTEDDL